MPVPDECLTLEVVTELQTGLSSFALLTQTWDMVAGLYFTISEIWKCEVFL